MKSPVVPLLLGLALIAGAIAIQVQRRTLHTADVRDISRLVEELDSVRIALSRASVGSDSVRLAKSIVGRTYIIGRREFHVPTRQESIDEWWTLTGAGTLFSVVGVLLIAVAIADRRRARTSDARTAQRDVMRPELASDVPYLSAFSAVRAAHVFTICVVGVIAFQLALVGGAPWGELTQGGGAPGVLSLPARAVAAVSAVLLVGMGVIVRARVGLLTAPWASRLARLVWFVVAYCALGVLANAATPSAAERRLWLPVVVVMLVCSVRVARSAAPTLGRSHER